MSLSRQDATRILNFCLGSDEGGLAEETADGACVVTITGYQAGAEVRRFEGATYEVALRRAAAAGKLTAGCLEKQIAFFAGAEPAAPSASGAGAGRAASGAEPFVEAARAIGALVHETQRERGFSSLVIGSRGRLFADDLLAQRARTDAQQAAVARVWARMAPTGSALGAHRWARAEAMLGPLAPLRAGIDEREIEAHKVIETFSSLNGALLATLDGALVAPIAGRDRVAALAVVALLHAKEKIGIERARLGTALIAGALGDEERLAIAGLVAARASYLHIFSAAAPEQGVDLARRVLAAPPAMAVHRIERLVVSQGRVPDMDAGAWFATVTRTIDALGEVGEAVLELSSHTTG